MLRREELRLKLRVTEVTVRENQNQFQSDPGESPSAGAMIAVKVASEIPPLTDRALASPSRTDIAGWGC
jgi:hypothetical protein